MTSCRRRHRYNMALVFSSLLLAWLALLLSTCFVQAEREKGRKRIGLLTASVPWIFGPYQSQMYALSLLLSIQQENGRALYDTHWISFVPQAAMPVGTYQDWQEMRPHLPNLVAPPDDFPLDHLTFIGMGQQQSDHLFASDLNAVADRHKLDAYIFLFDIGKVVPDVPFRVPVVAWVPLHSEVVSKSRPDYWVLKSYHSVAALSPSAARAIDNAVGQRSEPVQEFPSPLLQKMFGTTHVKFVPHIIDRPVLQEKAATGLRLLNHVDAREADLMLRDQTQNSKQRTSKKVGPNPLFANATDETFFVLMQGGNYDTLDRKGWDVAIQAFVRFYKATFDTNNDSRVTGRTNSGRVRAHLFLHSIESYLVSSEMNKDIDPPPDVLPKGLNLHLTLHESGLPHHAYTIDIALHQPEIVAAYKQRANVCLLPSKVEGFGMNVLECQALGTPVITTNYTAMGDFTRLGASVPYRQTVRTPGGLYEMALPNVEGIADALGALYQDYVASKRHAKREKLEKERPSTAPGLLDIQASGATEQREQEIRSTWKWIDSDFSADQVVQSFRELLSSAEEELQRRVEARGELLKIGQPPSSGAYQIAKGYHLTTVDWEAPWTIVAPDGLVLSEPGDIHMLCWKLTIKEQTPAAVMVLPAIYRDNHTLVPIVDEMGHAHEDLPIIIRTYVLAALQSQTSRRRSLVSLALKMAQSRENRGPMRLPDGLAMIVNRVGMGVEADQKGDSTSREEL